ncbi:MAG: T9SS type A sorting domain-containing protein [Bacteroidia bacterium]|nr:T9SS type A sorting domain-containing protein [Bacteroidia bacterium]
MKKNIFYIFVFCLFLSNKSQSQSIPNNDFENWTNKLFYEEPKLFMTSNGQAYSQNVKIPITKSTDKVSGNFSVKIETVSANSDPIPGMLIIGTPGFQSIKGGVTYTGRPDSITFFAKFSEMPGDTGAFVTFFKRKDTTIAMSRFTFIGNQASFKKYTIPVNWFRNGNADTIAVIVTSSNFDLEKKPGSVIYLDSITFVGSNKTFPNGNFENWNSISSLEPDNWFSFNFMSTNKPMLTRSTDKYSGNYALKIENVMMKFGDIMGFVTNGRITDSRYPVGGLAVKQNPLKISGYYKYVPQGPDTAIAGIFLYKRDAIKDTLILIEDTIIKLKPSNNNYVFFEIPIKYKSKEIADTINISFAASNIDDSLAYVGLGSTLFIDNLNIVYKPNSTKEQKHIKLYVYPNPISSDSRLKIENFELTTNNYSYIEIYNMCGKLIFKENIFKNEIDLSAKKMQAGIYFYKIFDGNNIEYSNGKIFIEQ